MDSRNLWISSASEGTVNEPLNRRFSKSPKVRRDNAPAQEIFDLSRPHPQIERKPVKQHQRLAGAFFDEMQSRAGNGLSRHIERM